MKNKMNVLKGLAVGTFGAVLALNSLASYAAEKVNTPDGFNNVLVYMGTGVFDPSISEPRPGLTGCEGLFCGGEYFQKEVMGRTDAETAEIAMQAKDFYLERFGINVDALVAEGRVAFDMFTLNPDFQYRVQIATGMKAASGQGWIIRDGGFRLMILDPDGMDLGGEFAGHHADQFNAMFFGNYNILATNDNGKPQKELIVFYKSRQPAVIAADGSMTFRCDMYNEEWGEGLGLGTLTVEPQADGTMRGNARNMLTFPATSMLNEFPAFPAYNSHPQ